MKRRLCIVLIMSSILLVLVGCNKKSRTVFKGSNGNEETGYIYLTVTVPNKSLYEDQYAVEINYGRSKKSNISGAYSLFYYNSEKVVKIADCASDFGTNTDYVAVSEGGFDFEEGHRILFNLYTQPVEYKLDTKELFISNSGELLFFIASSDYTFVSMEDFKNYTVIAFDYSIVDNNISIGTPANQ